MVTENPSCLYYFGSFVSDKEAKSHLSGYIEYLEEEDAQIIAIDIKQYKPQHLTVCEEKFSVNSLPSLLFLCIIIQIFANTTWIDAIVGNLNY